MTDDSTDLTPTSQTSAADATASRRARPGWLVTTVAAVFGLIYAYYEWDAIRNFVELPANYDMLGISRDQLPWGLLVASVIIPVLGYAIVFVLGRRHNLVGKIVFFVLGLTAVACLSLSVIALA